MEGNTEEDFANFIVHGVDFPADLVCGPAALHNSQEQCLFMLSAPGWGGARNVYGQCNLEFDSLFLLNI